LLVAGFWLLVILNLIFMSYKNLEIWKLADELIVEIHEMTLTKLPKFEMFEEGSQIRRSSKSVKATIVEGYGRKRYKAEFIKFLVYSPGSNDETIDHLENLYKTRSLQDEILYNCLHAKLETLGKKINLFIKGVDNASWENRSLTSIQRPETSNQQPGTSL
jgi:four helix bundle protein